VFECCYMHSYRLYISLSLSKLNVAADIAWYDKLVVCVNN
jgi:hypothetical protein